MLQIERLLPCIHLYDGLIKVLEIQRSKLLAYIKAQLFILKTVGISRNLRTKESINCGNCYAVNR